MLFAYVLVFAVVSELAYRNCTRRAVADGHHQRRRRRAGLPWGAQRRQAAGGAPGRRDFRSRVKIKHDNNGRLKVVVLTFAGFPRPDHLRGGANGLRQLPPPICAVALSDTYRPATNLPSHKSGCSEQP